MVAELAPISNRGGSESTHCTSPPVKSFYAALWCRSDSTHAGLALIIFLFAKLQDRDQKKKA